MTQEAEIGFRALEKEAMEIELKLKEAELKLLKAQIHPHFLFNTLNNLYGLALSGSKKAPEMILKISSLLDFMLYRSTKPYVRLEEELNYIRKTWSVPLAGKKNAHMTLNV